MFCSLVLSNKVKLSSLFYHYCIDEWIIHLAYEYLVYEDFCGGVGGNLTDHKSKSILDKVNTITSLERKLNLLSAQYKKTDFNRYIRYRGKLSLISLIGYFLPYPLPTKSCLQTFCTGCQTDNILH